REQVAGRRAGLPSWTRTMTTGPKAAGTGPRATPPDPAAGLSGEWIPRPAESPAAGDRTADSPACANRGAGDRGAGERTSGDRAAGERTAENRPAGPVPAGRTAPVPEAVVRLAGRHEAGL
ncbi:serine/threonine protein kinase, partial [Streptomyces sp. SID6013]|nr:serine/threonine protein kinase [Streptomyces sp. SID6013]